MNNRRAPIKTALVLLAFALVPAAGAQAQSLENASAQLQLSPSLAKKLKKEGVRLTALKPAQAKGRSVTLPTTEGSLEPRYGSGYLYLGGGFKWRAGKKTATLRRLLFNPEKHVLTAVVSGSTIKLAELSPQQPALTNFDFTDAVKSMKLTGRAASTLNRRLGLHGVFEVGRSLGAITAGGRFEYLQVSGGEVTLTVDNGFREKLKSVEADVRAPTLTASIEMGRITSGLGGAVTAGEPGLVIFQHETSEHGEAFDRAIGFLDTGISLESHTVSGTANVNFEPPRVPYSGPIATIPSSPIQFNAETGEASGAFPVALAPQLASLLNETIGAARGKSSLFSAGDALGTVSFTAPTR
jgi:hypothetical protein